MYLPRFGFPLGMNDFKQKYELKLDHHFIKIYKELQVINYQLTDTL